MSPGSPEQSAEDVIQRGTPMRTADNLDAAIYARTSSASQRFGYSLDEQVRRCWEQCQQLNWDVTHVFRDEAQSGSDIDRPMFQKLLTEAEAEMFDVAVFWKLDRFSRSLIHAVELERDFRDWGVALYSITEQIDTTTPTGRFNFRNISSASEFERDLIKQRSRMEMKALAMENKWPNDRPPLGYRKQENEKLEIIPNEADLVRKIFRRYLELKSMPELANELNDDCESTKTGADWTAQKVSAILRNRLYIGEYSVADVEEHVEEYQIITQSLFDTISDVRMRFRRSGNTDIDQMSESRKDERITKVLDQYEVYLSESHRD